MSHPLNQDLEEDMRLRWSKGDRPRAIDYLESLTSTRLETSQLLDLIYCEVQLREEYKEQIDVDIFLEQFPGLDGDIRKLFEVHDALGGMVDGSVTSIQTPRDKSADNEAEKNLALDSNIAKIAAAGEAWYSLHDLLFGVLAVQLEIVTRSRLLDAMRHSPDRCIQLPSLLSEKQLISTKEINEVNQYLQRVLNKYGGDYVRALGEKLDYEFRNALRDLGNEMAQHTVNLLPASSQYIHVELADTVQIDKEGSKSRYTLTRLHGKGGLGQVWLARDQILQRQVALKEPIRREDLTVEHWQQFILEAQITGQLEHPNIVPVYELIKDRDTREVFYTMRFVNGQTMSGAIASYHKQRVAGREDPMELRKLLAAFVNICQALAYAHSRGVIHRDLKPSNVMLGAYGEVMVLDWGLAKVIGRASSDLPVVRLRSDVKVEDTEFGRVKGTIYFMSPEQAAGLTDLVDSRADIYGLGGILFSIISGNEPHRGQSETERSDDIIRRIVESPPPRARNVLRSAPPALDAICLKAMAKRPSDRYANALEMAADVQRWLADEEVSVYRDHLTARAWRWVRRHRIWATAICISGLIVTCISIASASMIQLALGKARASLVAEQKAKLDELAAKEEATRRLRQSQTTVDKMLTGVDEILRFYPSTTEVRSHLLREAVNSYEDFIQSPLADPLLKIEAARSKIRLGEILAQLGETQKARRYFEQAHAELGELHAKLGLKGTVLDRASCLLKMGELDADIGADSSAEKMYGDASDCLDSQIESHERSYLQSLILWRRAALTGKSSPVKALKSLGEAESVLTALLRENSLARSQKRDILHHLSLVRCAIGECESKLGNNEASAKVLQLACDAYHDLVASEPDSLSFIEGYAFAKIHLANVLGTLARERERAELLDAAIDDCAVLVGKLPDSPRIRENLAVARSNRATLLQEDGFNSEAMKLLDLSIEDFSDLNQRSAETIRYVEEIATSAVVLARVLSELENNAAAELNFANAIAAYSQLLEKHQHLKSIYKNRGAAHRHYARHLLGTGQKDRAKEELRRAKEDLSASLELGDDPFSLDELSLVYEEMGNWAKDADQLEESHSAYGTALDLRQRLPNDPEYRFKRAKLLLRMNNYTDSLLEAKTIATRFPQMVKYQSLFAEIQIKQNEHANAKETLLKCDPQVVKPSSTLLFLLAESCLASNEEAERAQAKQYFTRAVERMNTFAPGNSELREWYRSLRDSF